MSISYDDYQKISNIFLKNNNMPSLFSKEELKEVISIITTLPYYKELISKRGYICLKEICLNMTLKFFPAQTKVKRYNKDRTKYLHLLYGYIKEYIDYSGRSALKRELCLTDCCYAKFNFENYINITSNDINILIKNFVNRIKNFFPFQQLNDNDYYKLFLCYDEIDFRIDDYVYKEGDDVDGIYLILEGVFEVNKKLIKKNVSIELINVEKKLKYLKRENKYLNHLLTTNYISRNVRNNLNNEINNNSKMLFFSSNDVSNIKVRIIINNYF